MDLLGDQVDVLVGLLEKIYTILSHHSPVLHQYFEVSKVFFSHFSCQGAVFTDA